ncbi:hypothetical protein SAMN02927923_01966 [Microvirga guangxiensis]|uniref:Uncharacterized protein n=1 Tax=Microvirga guangxiensis TaxID=549386 RepID=A0A1G5HY98_9HYPH|nr:hypothetical protein SAMN02927923_01966 [Microvirga guangxiensis]
MEARCRITSGGGDPRDSATESRPPRKDLRIPEVRVKGCGKSAPRTQQCGRHGKPHQEQNRIGTTGVRARPASRLVVRVGCLRRSAMIVPEEWPPRSRVRPWAIQNPAYRPADPFFSTGRKLRQSGAKRCPAYDSLTTNASHGECRLQGLPSNPVPLTPILSHVIPNHPVDGAFRRGR